MLEFTNRQCELQGTTPPGVDLREAEGTGPQGSGRGQDVVL